MKRRDEESSPSDALVPKKRKTRLAGKVRTYLWACRQLPPLNPIVLPTAFVKKKMRGCQPNGMNRCDTCYLLILMLLLDVSLGKEKAALLQ